MNNFEDFVQAAHRKAVFSHLLRYMQEYFISVDLPANKTLPCEESVGGLRVDPVVSQDALAAVAEKLSAHVAEELEILGGFELRKKDDKKDGPTKKTPVKTRSTKGKRRRTRRTTRASKPNKGAQHDGNSEPASSA